MSSPPTNQTPKSPWTGNQEQTALKSNPADKSSAPASNSQALSSSPFFSTSPNRDIGRFSGALANGARDRPARYHVPDHEAQLESRQFPTQTSAPGSAQNAGTAYAQTAPPATPSLANARQSPISIAPPAGPRRTHTSEDPSWRTPGGPGWTAPYASSDIGDNMCPWCKWIWDWRSGEVVHERRCPALTSAVEAEGTEQRQARQ